MMVQPYLSKITSRNKLHLHDSTAETSTLLYRNGDGKSQFGSLNSVFPRTCSSGSAYSVCSGPYQHPLLQVLCCFHIFIPWTQIISSFKTVRSADTQMALQETSLDMETNHYCAHFSSCVILSFQLTSSLCS